MTKTDTVSTRLWKLMERISNVVKTLQTSGGITQTRTVYVKPKFKEFRFTDGAVDRISWEWESVEKTEWHWLDQFKFLETTVKKLAEYVDAFKLISKTYGVAESQADFYLSRFAYVLSKMSLEEAKQEDLIQAITTFVSDLDGAPRNWVVRVWLNGLWTTDPDLTVLDGLTLRHPHPADFEVERPFDPAYWGGHYGEGIPPLRYPSAILELKKRAKDQPEMHDELETLLTTLRLFHLGSVAALRSYWTSDSILGFGQFTTASSSVVPADRYPISTAELDDLRTFIQRIRPLIPRELIRGGESTDYMITSLQRFNDAMLKSEPPESRMTFSIMSLEALYLKSGEREELEHRLGQRIAKILSLCGNDPMKVYNMLKRSYEVRSKFVHGEPLEKADRQYAADNLPIVLEYNRASLVVSLQMKEKMTKEQLLNLVDNSLLCPDAEAKLDEKIKQLCSVR